MSAAPEQPPAPAAPPRHWEADVLLRDGSTAHIRPIRPEDAELLVDFYGRVSDRSKYYRFFSPMPRLSDRDVERFLLHLTLLPVDEVARYCDTISYTLLTGVLPRAPRRYHGAHV